MHMALWIYDKKTGECHTTDSLAEWMQWQAAETVRTAYETVDECTISTMFLSIDCDYDGPPVLFETMIFGGEHDRMQWRYCTADEAIAGHKRIVEALKRGESPEE